MSDRLIGRVGSPCICRNCARSPSAQHVRDYPHAHPAFLHHARMHMPSARRCTMRSPTHTYAHTCIQTCTRRYECVWVPALSRFNASLSSTFAAVNTAAVNISVRIVRAYMVIVQLRLCMYAVLGLWMCVCVHACVYYCVFVYINVYMHVRMTAVRQGCTRV